MKLSNLFTIDDYRRAAHRALPKSLFEFVDGGSDAELTMRRNRRAFDETFLLPRAATPVVPDVATTVMGVPVSMPILLAPCGQLRLIHTEGDLASSAAARKLGTASMISSASGHSLEEIARSASPSAGFFQLYKLGGHAGAQQMLERAQGAGYAGLVVTIDTAVGGNRVKDRRNGYDRGIQVNFRNAVRHGPGMALRPLWLSRFIRGGLAFELGNVVDQHGQIGVPASEMATLLKATPFDWDDVRWIRSLWKGPLAIKGIITPEDARKAVGCGADAIVISNHGGRQLDSQPASFDMLPSVVEAVGPEIEVLIDGGIRRGGDVVKALALGARAVLIGRPYVWGLATAGQAGVEHVLEILRSELERDMILLGRSSLADLDRTVVVARSR